MFKKGDKFICVNDDDFPNDIKMGEVYTIIVVGPDNWHECYELDNKEGDWGNIWHKSHFGERFILDCPLARAIYGREDVAR